MVLAGCSNTTNQTAKDIDISELPIETTTVSYGIDVDNPKEAIGSAHYVFVGRVDEVVETVYIPLDRENPEKAKEEDKLPFTNYKVSVLENIKGELQQEVEIPLQKQGGITKDGAKVFMLEDDYLPKEGDICIFRTFVQIDGQMTGEGKNSSILLQEGVDKTRSSEEYKEAGIYQEYVEAAKEPVDSGRERSISEYDVSNQ